MASNMQVVCEDETKVDISLAAARQCDVFKDLIGEMPDAEAVQQELALADVKSEAFKKALPFLELAAANPISKPSRPLLNKNLEKDGADASSVAFIRGLPLADVFDLLQTADSVRCTPLAELAAARLAEHYLSYEDSQKDILFNEGKKMTEEQEKKLGEAHKWACEEPDIDAEYITKMLIAEGTLNPDGTVPDAK